MWSSGRDMRVQYGWDTQLRQSLNANALSCVGWLGSSPTEQSCFAVCRTRIITLLSAFRSFVLFLEYQRCARLSMGPLTSDIRQEVKLPLPYSVVQKEVSRWSPPAPRLTTALVSELQFCPSAVRIPRRRNSFSVACDVCKA
jgi:hypothetical protein